MSETPLPAPEMTPSPEHVSSFEPLIGLQARLLLGGDHLNPAKKDIGEIKPEQITGDFQTRDYSRLENASIRERKEHWGTEKDFDTQKREWVEKTVATFTNAKQYFTQNPQGKQWSEVFHTFGLNTQNVTAQEAENLYARYFVDQTHEHSIQKYILDVIGKYSRQQGNQLAIDYHQLRQDLPAIQWLTGIFGGNSSEVVVQMIDAEIQNIAAKQSFLEKANQKNDQGIHRVNDIKPGSREEHLLQFLWEKGQPITPAQEPPRPQTPPPQKRHPHLPEGHGIRYERLGAPPQFPEEESISTHLSPQHVSEELKKTYPNDYQNEPVDALAQKIEQEKRDLQEALDAHGLTEEYLLDLTGKTLLNYETFIKNHYGVPIPHIKNLHIQPLDGHMAKLYHPEPTAFAFVIPTMPVIFLDFRKIEQEAHAIGAAHGWQNLSKDQLGQLMTRLLLEINPHEYTHLISDLAFWKVYKKTGQGEETVSHTLGKVGLEVAKPTPPRYFDENGELIVRGRGGKLMEAVTVEMTSEWARNMTPPAHLDIDAYAEERAVLDALTTLLANEQHISKKEAFKKFVQGSFSPRGYKRLVQELSGKEISHVTKTMKGEAKNITYTRYKRPHYMEMIYGLMEYDAQNPNRPAGRPFYDLTLSFIKHSNNIASLPEPEKRALLTLLQTPQTPDSPIFISHSTRKRYIHMLTQPLPQVDRPTLLQNPEHLHPDFEKMRNSYRFAGEHGDDYWNNASEIRKIYTSSEIAKKGLPVYYPGSGFDAIFPLLYTDENTFVFTDYVYIKGDGSLRDDYIPDSTIETIGGTITSVTTEGILGHGGKRIVKFNWGGKERTLIMYAEDATKFVPEEIQNGTSFIVIKAPTPFARSAEEDVPGSIWDSESIDLMFQKLAIGGFVHWDPTHALPPEVVGMKQVITIPKALDDSRSEEGYPLYQKIRDEQYIVGTLKLDGKLRVAFAMRDGGYWRRINESTPHLFEDNLKDAREAFDQLPTSKKQEILQYLAALINPQDLSEQQKTNFRRYGLHTEEQMNTYLQQTVQAAQRVFPELA